MKQKLLMVLFLVVSGLLPGVALSVNAQTTPDEVVDFVNRYDKAWSRKDIASIKHTFAADYVYFTSKGGVWSLQRILDLLRSPKYILKSAERSEIGVYQTGNTAIVSSRWKGHGSYDGEEFRDDQRCSIVLARKGRRW